MFQNKILINPEILVNKEVRDLKQFYLTYF